MKGFQGFYVVILTVVIDEEQAKIVYGKNGNDTSTKEIEKNKTECFKRLLKTETNKLYYKRRDSNGRDFKCRKCND